ncbi:MAG: hypothetical protein PHY92_09145 [Alphaproteobacteria bacterium]|nr:hypothetical protein [Alphaproteobacteria bacterium]
MTKIFSLRVTVSEEALAKAYRMVGLSCQECLTTLPGQLLKRGENLFRIESKPYREGLAYRIVTEAVYNLAHSEKRDAFIKLVKSSEVPTVETMISVNYFDLDWPSNILHPYKYGGCCTKVKSLERRERFKAQPINCPANEFEKAIFCIRGMGPKIALKLIAVGLIYDKISDLYKPVYDPEAAARELSGRDQAPCAADEAALRKEFDDAGLSLTSVRRALRNNGIRTTLLNLIRKEFPEV